MAHIDQRLDEFDLPASVLFREIAGEGYDGGLTTVRNYVRSVKKSKIKRLTERFETVPGKQAQLDWGECGFIDVNGQRLKLYVFVYVLGFSRMLFARFTTSTRRNVLFDCLKEALEALGRPSEMLLDNMKQAVDAHPIGGTARFNPEFLDFCQHYDVAPLAAPPYWARIKGKVERGVGFIKSSFLEGRSFADLADLNAQLDAWLQTVANVRIHGTTGEQPAVRYQRELAHLRPCAAIPGYDTRSTELRQVHSDSHVRYRRVLYSVHPDAVGKTVTMRPHGQDVGDVLEIYLGDQLVGSHLIAPPHRRRVTTEEHNTEILRRSRRGSRSDRPRRSPAFRQTGLESDTAAIPHVEVQTRSLSLYEALLNEVAA